MKIWKIISGIISMLGGVLLGALTVFISFVALVFSGDAVGLIGLLAAVLLFAAGAVSVATCRARRKSNIALIVIFACNAALCFWRYDPIFWLLYPAIWSAACAIVAVVFLCIPDKEPTRPVVHSARYITPQFTPDAHFASQRIGAPPVAPPKEAPPRQYRPQYPQPTKKPPQDGE